MARTRGAQHGMPCLREGLPLLQPGSAATFFFFGVTVLVVCAPQSVVASKNGDLQRMEKTQVDLENPGRPSFTEELTVETFIQKVQKVANSSQGQRTAYYPIVFFHVSWCDHCRRALPEFDDAAERVFRAVEGGQILNYPILPKFFIFHCQNEEEVSREICSRHTGGKFPALMLFRDKRTIVYNRPRFAATMAWWALRVTRPATSKMLLQRHLDSYSHEVVFMLFADSKKDSALIAAWVQIALGYLDQYNFAVVHPDSELCRKIIGRRKVPAVDVRAPADYGLEPVAMQGALGRQTLEAWVNFNQFPLIVELTPWTIKDLQESGLRVVTFVHVELHTATKAFKEFRSWVRKLRRRGRYIFAALNTSDVNVLDMVMQRFPLVSPPIAELPCLFTFTGRVYWEDPDLVKPFTANFESLEALQNSAEAYQDDSLSSWFKKVKKLVFRFSSKSWMSFSVVAAIPLALAALCHRCCCRASSKAPPALEPGQADHAAHDSDENVEHIE